MLSPNAVLRAFEKEQLGLFILLYKLPVFISEISERFGLSMLIIRYVCLSIKPAISPFDSVCAFLVPIVR